ncbi:hypothetical protein PAPYR_7905 [Paratrimastix pyriformis]|uniref:Uncharacterized protein n=1 Tax=Paratrimastix pyriformis TaxID=342808 RepID=A0ABQ8UBX1_9EUKA|nr:hypothetical protein PAPYR_7905 [Paratrimastix pyriformis]
MALILSRRSRVVRTLVLQRVQGFRELCWDRRTWQDHLDLVFSPSEFPECSSVDGTQSTSTHCRKKMLKVVTAEQHTQHFWIMQALRRVHGVMAISLPFASAPIWESLALNHPGLHSLVVGGLVPVELRRGLFKNVDLLPAVSFPLLGGLSALTLLLPPKFLPEAHHTEAPHLNQLVGIICAECRNLTSLSIFTRSGAFDLGMLAPLGRTLTELSVTAIPNSLIGARPPHRRGVALIDFDRLTRCRGISSVESNLLSGVPELLGLRAANMTPGMDLQTSWTKLRSLRLRGFTLVDALQPAETAAVAAMAPPLGPRLGPNQEQPIRKSI